jgi:hypothetical protein
MKTLQLTGITPASRKSSFSYLHFPTKPLTPTFARTSLSTIELTARFRTRPTPIFRSIPSTYAKLTHRERLNRMRWVCIAVALYPPYRKLTATQGEATINDSALQVAEQITDLTITQRLK